MWQIASLLQIVAMLLSILFSSHRPHSTQIILASLEAHPLLLNFIIYLLSSVWKLQIEGAAYGYVKCVLDENAAPWDCSLIP